MASDLHDGAQLRSKFILANSGSSRDSDERVNLDSRVEDVLKAGLENRNTSVSSVGTFGKSSSQSSSPVVGEKVMAWGIVAQPEEVLEESVQDLASSIIVDQGDRVAGWYEATLLSIDRSGCEVNFDDETLTRAVTNAKLPLHLVSKILPEGAQEEPICEEDDIEDLLDSQLAPIIIDEVPLPELRVPGNVLHIWSQRGVYRISHVGCADPVLTNFKL